MTVDIVVALLLLGAAVSGWGRGLLLSVLSTAGFLAGAALGMWTLPSVVDAVAALRESLPMRALTLCLAVLLLAVLGQAVMTGMGVRLRSRNRRRPTQVLDAVGGSVASLLVATVLVWFAGDTIRVAAPTDIARSLSASHLLRGIDAVMPAQVGRAFAGFRARVEDSEFPRVFEGLAAEPIAPAQPPDPRVVQTPGVVAAGRSIVKIVGDAPACRREQDGSGWVAAPHRVITNAHVVAGTTRLRVQVGGEGRRYSATVVTFDPRLDIAVLDVPSLPAPALAVVPDLRPRQDAVVAGFPGGGPYHLGAARVRAVMPAKGSDIYGGTGVVREVYSLYATVRPGASGGPLLTTDGKVAGTIFASSVDDPSTGYALTSSATADQVRAAADDNTPASTGSCATR